MHKLAHAAGLLGSMVLAGPAQAGRPLQSEDAAVLDARSCEIEAAGLRLSSGGTTRTTHGIALACGVGRNSQVGLDVTATHQAGERPRAAELAGKSSLWEAAGAPGPALTVAWMLGLAREGDRGWEHQVTDLKLVASLPLRSTTLHLNLGHLHEISPRLATTTWAAALEHGGFDIGGWTFAPMAELFGADRGQPWWNIATRVTVVADRLFLDFSYGRQTGSGQQLLTAGFKLAF